MSSAEPETAAFDAESSDTFVLDNVVEEPNRIRAAVDACDQHIGQPILRPS